MSRSGSVMNGERRLLLFGYSRRAAGDWFGGRRGDQVALNQFAVVKTDELIAKSIDLFFAVGD